MDRIVIPDFCLILLIGPSGAGKSTFAAAHFAPTEVVSSDACRALVSDDATDQAATPDAFLVLRTLVEARLRRRRLTVVDATHLQPEHRAEMIHLAQDAAGETVAFVFDTPFRTALDRINSRADRLPKRVLQRQFERMRGLGRLDREGFTHVIRVRENHPLSLHRQAVVGDERTDLGPFDIVGDIHGCQAVLCALLTKAGYRLDPMVDPVAWTRLTPPPGRRLIWLGDLIDRGPDSVGVLRMILDAVERGVALGVMGNHDDRLRRVLQGEDLSLTHGLDHTVSQLRAQPDFPELKLRLLAMLSQTPTQRWLDQGRLLVAHAGLPAELHGRCGERARSFALYGDPTGAKRPDGSIIRTDWAAHYHGNTRVVYGHEPTQQAQWRNNTLCLDLGCVFGGALAFLRWPEQTIEVEGVGLPTPVKTLAKSDSILPLPNLTAPTIVPTRWMGSLTIPALGLSTAVSAMTRFGHDPRLLCWIPPTMAAVDTAPAGTGVLERPQEAFAMLRGLGITRALCQAKHMGSRMVVLVGRSASHIAQAFGVSALGSITTRSGRPMFSPDQEHAWLCHIQATCAKAGLFDELGDWILLDGELLPWSAKAEGLIRTQYAPTGIAGGLGLDHAMAAVSQAVTRGVMVPEDLILALERGRHHVLAYQEAWHRFAPTHVPQQWAVFACPASQLGVWDQQPQDWHQGLGQRLAEHDPSGVFAPTAHRWVDLTDQDAVAAACDWWTTLTTSGLEGMVVKPPVYAQRGKKGLVHPGIKVRGPEYLRLVYGPEYPDHIKRLGQRNTAAKARLGLREFALGIEALDRRYAGQSQESCHQALLGILALHAEATDPRL